MIKEGDLIDGTYYVLRILGQGGMGFVVEARDIKLDTLVAIKFMKAEVLAEQETVERFMQEARALARLKSHHAVKVFTVGTYQSMPYIVMEHLDGQPLNRLLNDRMRLPASEAAWYLGQACKAIHEAHIVGILHRDIKPANLFLEQRVSDESVIKVLDFGIAKMVKQADETLRKGGGLTGTYSVMGTPPYMSPEQWMATRDVDARSDVWSLGVTLYEMVTGELPFQGTGMYELQKAIIEGYPIRRQLPPEIEAIVDRCLRKNKKERFQSVDELARALRPIAVDPGSAPILKVTLPPQSSTAGGTVVMNPKPNGTITIRPQAPGQTPHTFSNDPTRQLPQSTKRNRLSQRVVGLVVAGGAALLAVIAGVVLGREDKFPENATPVAPVSVSPQELLPVPPPSATVQTSATTESPRSAPAPSGTGQKKSPTTPTKTSTPAAAGPIGTTTATNRKKCASLVDLHDESRIGGSPSVR
jgi:serine/threonine protein kinase